MSGNSPSNESSEPSRGSWTGGFRDPSRNRQHRDPVGPGQESVWDYPRPPALESIGDVVRIVIGEFELATSGSAYRILETSHPPTVYIPPGDIVMDRLVPAPGGSLCEWKGRADYWTYQTPERVIERIAWSYPAPVARYAELKDLLAFYPSKCDACYVGEHRVTAQPGDFYGGWITPNIVGPFKGSSGTMGW